MFANKFQSSPPSVSLDRHAESPDVSADENISDGEDFTWRKPVGRGASSRSFRRSSTAAHMTPNSLPSRRSRSRVRQTLEIKKMEKLSSDSSLSPDTEPEEPLVRKRSEVPEPTERKLTTSPTVKETKLIRSVSSTKLNSLVEQSPPPPPIIGTEYSFIRPSGFHISQIYQTFTTGAAPWRSVNNPWMNRLYNHSQGIFLAQGPPTSHTPIVISPYWYTSGTVTVSFFPLRDNEQNIILPDTPHGIVVFRFVCFLNLTGPQKGSFICELIPDDRGQVVALSKRKSVAHQNGVIFRVQVFPNYIKEKGTIIRTVGNPSKALNISSWYYLDFSVGHVKAMNSDPPESSSVSAHRLAWSAKLDLTVNQV